MSNYVYEAMDVTDDECYCSLGIWLTLDDCLLDIDSCKDPTDLGSDNYLEDLERCEIEVLKRKIGWPTEDNKIVAKRTWTATFNSETDELEWERVNS